MNWLNLNIQTLDSENFLGSEPIDRATWLCLQRFCIGQENSGIIPDCRDWADRKWQQLVRITKKEVSRVCDLWSWDGNSLIVWAYPLDKEAEIQHLREIGRSTSSAKRDAAKANGSKGGRPKNNPTENPTETEQETHAEPIERKGSRKEYPHTPKGDEGGEFSLNGNAPKPRATKKLTQTQKHRTKHPDITPTMARIGSWFARQPETRWSAAEFEALQAVNPSDKEIGGMEAYYTASITEDDYRRHDLYTLLNNWPGELDRARKHYLKTQRASA
jgi:hypothetical protein